jgi:hypothetical protein
LADHAFSLVIHADPVCPTDTPAWVKDRQPSDCFHITNMPNIGVLEKSQWSRTMENAPKI